MTKEDAPKIRRIITDAWTDLLLHVLEPTTAQLKAAALTGLQQAEDRGEIKLFDDVEVEVTRDPDDPNRLCFTVPTRNP